MAKIDDLRFLVMDDMLTMRKVVSQTLKALGVTKIQEANDGSTAWELLDKKPDADESPSFIVSDWNMPPLKGIDFLRRCRADERRDDEAIPLKSPSPAQQQH